MTLDFIKKLLVDEIKSSPLDYFIEESIYMTLQFVF